MVDQRTASSMVLFQLRNVAFACVVSFCLSSCQSYTDKAVGTKSSANETVVIGALRAIASAQAAYSISRDGEYGSFEELVAAGNLDVRFGGEHPVIGGYVLSMRVTAKDSGAPVGSYAVNADPQQTVAAGSTGSRHFYMGSTDSAIHVNAKQPAGSTDTQL